MRSHTTVVENPKTGADMKNDTDAIGEVMTSFVNSWKREVVATKKEDLGKYWYWKYDPDMSKEFNLYKFSDALESYKRTCRMWEEHHNGYSCVVERVRDTYILPKVREAIELFE